MTTLPKLPTRLPLLVRGSGLLFAACLPLLTNGQPAPAPAAAGPAASAAEVFRRLAADRWVSREITFADLGFKGPLVLGAPETVRELYLPVPANVPISAGEIKLNANYMRADGGRTSFVVSLDSYPVSSRPMAQDKGDASLVLGVDGSPRPSGFVRMGLNWSSAMGAEWQCTDGRAAGNVLRIEPDSRFTYRYDGSAVRDLTTAWGALPSAPVILISSNNLSSGAYDSAWRMGVALERAGKRARVVALPAVGDTVNLDGLAVPAALRGIPAFAALAQGGSYKLKDAAEVGALLSLGAGSPLRADIVIADKALTTGMAASLDALRGQLQTAAPDAVAGFAEWRTRALDPAAQPAAAGEIRLSQAFGNPAIVVAADAGAQAAGMFSTYWNRIAVASSLLVRSAADPAGDASAVSLKYLGGKPGSFDVLSHADWNASFDIGAVAADGRLPSSLVLDVAAAPSAARTPPVVSVFLNDILLGARQMDANGKVESVTARIPAYALASRNTLRVTFVRQLASDRCRETPEPYPVSVLPSSRMLLEKADPSADFTGMVARYAAGAHVMVPAAYLADATASLPRVIRLASTTGVSPMKARFTAVTGDAVPAPGGAFLAMELPFKDAKSRVTLEEGRLVMDGGSDGAVIDIKGLDKIAIVEVVKAGGDSGVLYRTVAGQSPALDKPLLLGAGDIAVIGPNGLLTEMNMADPAGRKAVGDNAGPWLLARGYWWMLPILGVVFMIALLVFASRVRRRKSAEKDSAL
ncbi:MULTISPECIES: cellulose biosynthesis cyclic di-GMP-binding regulatory protein BcsB [unclassified Polaromonas]|uniref:cellulose biosynthesis cyclic di-GMP-binding regulatory protein BcsB n=1 Tax=unclassified Polaromonas TaxID=2638319 RepID=UPI000F0922F1|nr:MULTISPECIES: cellulose biosynthesis cyclic di-GMP-binding regulatory protein BcsB [unclassified Polaromonas]AYQ27420.1 cellulose synthase [Polaromonas sp. SP1]QGJ17738.1 cellulose synthase [Polaromonas sp. Pch-P]